MSGFVVRFVPQGSAIARYVYGPDSVTRDHGKAHVFFARADAFAVEREWSERYPGACVDVFYADPSENDGQPISEDDLHVD